jgi:hypothetical protein
MAVLALFIKQDEILFFKENKNNVRKIEGEGTR